MLMATLKNNIVAFMYLKTVMLSTSYRLILQRSHLWCVLDAISETFLAEN
jgi:hypothetical protein